MSGMAKDAAPMLYRCNEPYNNNAATSSRMHNGAYARYKHCIRAFSILNQVSIFDMAHVKPGLQPSDWSLKSHHQSTRINPLLASYTSSLND
jgi:hypothetical protein